MEFEIKSSQTTLNFNVNVQKSQRLQESFYLIKKYMNSIKLAIAKDMWRKNDYFLTRSMELTHCMICFN
jgi:hypothetical protein